MESKTKPVIPNAPPKPPNNLPMCLVNNQSPVLLPGLLKPIYFVTSNPQQNASPGIAPICIKGPAVNQKNEVSIAPVPIYNIGEIHQQHRLVLKPKRGRPRKEKEESPTKLISKLEPVPPVISINSNHMSIKPMPFVNNPLISLQMSPTTSKPTLVKLDLPAGKIGNFGNNFSLVGNNLVPLTSLQGQQKLTNANIVLKNPTASNSSPVKIINQISLGNIKSNTSPFKVAAPSPKVPILLLEDTTKKIVHIPKNNVGSKKSIGEETKKTLNKIKITNPVKGLDLPMIETSAESETQKNIADVEMPVDEIKEEPEVHSDDERKNAVAEAGRSTDYDMQIDEVKIDIEPFEEEEREGAKKATTSPNENTETAESTQNTATNEKQVALPKAPQDIQIIPNQPPIFLNNFIPQNIINPLSVPNPQPIQFSLLPNSGGLNSVASNPPVGFVALPGTSTNLATSQQGVNESVQTIDLNTTTSVNPSKSFLVSMTEYEYKNTILKFKELYELKDEMVKIQQKNIMLVRALNILNKKCNILHEIFSESQVRQLQVKSKKPAWSVEDITKALEMLKNCGIQGYKYLYSQKFPYPKYNTLKYWKKRIEKAYNEKFEKMDENLLEDDAGTSTTDAPETENFYE